MKRIKHLTLPIGIPDNYMNTHKRILYIYSIFEIRRNKKASDLFFCRFLTGCVGKLCSVDDTAVWQPYIAKYPWSPASEFHLRGLRLVTMCRLASADPSSFAHDLQSQILQNSEIGDFTNELWYEAKWNAHSSAAHPSRIYAKWTCLKLSIDRSFLSHIESGKKGCSVDLLVQLSGLFNVSLDYIALGKGELSMKEEIEELIAHLTSFKESLDSVCD